MITQSPSFCKPHLLSVYPTDQHTPIARRLCSKLALIPHCVTAYVLNVLVRKETNVKRDINLEALYPPVLMMLAFSLGIHSIAYRRENERCLSTKYKGPA